ncbi:hypothetical protein GCM10022295_89410 [Streptomyces osmaniensis]|uniref:Transposase n=1 Tax=Streptomyces osmaniensis TaxID=593134 RepID=A0ABP6Z3W8_9ACTN
MNPENAARKTLVPLFHRSQDATANEHRAKVLTTQTGDLDLAIPKVRTGSFFLSLLERRRRTDQALLRRDHGGIRARSVHPQRG